MDTLKKAIQPLALITLLCLLTLFYFQQNNIDKTSNTSFIPTVLSENRSAIALIDPQYNHLLKFAPNSIEAKESSKEIVAQLINERPSIIIAPNTYHWQLISPSNWFQQNYEEVEQQENIRVFTKRPWGTTNQIEPIDVETTLGASLVGYTISPKSFTPDTPIYITLYWQALGQVTPFNTVIQVISTTDGTPRAQVTEITPRAIPSDLWETGQIIEERITLTTVPETEIGSYQLNLSIYGLSSSELLPIYQNKDDNVLDKVTLSYISAPYEGEVAPSAEKIDTIFADGIKLHAKELNYITENNEIAIDLYWQATTQPQISYTIFLHLFDQNGNFVLSRDAIPRNGSYTTNSWQPQQTIKDPHIIPLSEDLAQGTYTVKVGMYDSTTQLRLAVEEGPNVNVAESNITIGQIEIP